MQGSWLEKGTRRNRYITASLQSLLASATVCSEVLVPVEDKYLLQLTDVFS